jgi:hypothetical protein
MNSATKAVNQRLASLLWLCAVPMMAFGLGRQSLTFTGNKEDWLLLSGNIFALGVGLYEASKGIRNAP